MKEVELVRLMAQYLVDTPEKVEVSEIKAHQSKVIELKVDKSDIGKIIGKEGRTAQAMRTILNAMAAKEKKRMILEIIEPK